jgi:hypothetical protein
MSEETGGKGGRIMLGRVTRFSSASVDTSTDSPRLELVRACVPGKSTDFSDNYCAQVEGTYIPCNRVLQAVQVRRF